MNSYIAPAQPRTEIWRVLAGLCIVFAALLGSGLALGLAMMALRRAEVDWAPGLGFDTASSTLFLLATFLFWRPALWLALRLFHGRPLSSLFSPSGKVNWKRFWRGVAIASGFAVASGALGWALVGGPVWTGVELSAWLPIALIAAPLIYVQTSAEELLFRGYLLQQFAARFTAVWAWAVLPSILFGLLHWNPAGYGGSALTVLFVTGMLGLIFALITALTGDLSYAMGMHFGVNMIALLLIAPSENFAGMSLAYWPSDPSATLAFIWIDFAILFAAVLATTLVWRRLRAV